MIARADIFPDALAGNYLAGLPAGLLSVKDAADWLDCAANHVMDLIRAGELDGVDGVDGVGKGRKVTAASLERLVERHAVVTGKRA